MKRRHFLQLGLLGTGVVGGSAFGNQLAASLVSKTLRPPKAIAIDLFDSFSSELKDAFVVGYDDPWRQYHNRGVGGGGTGIGIVDLTSDQQSLMIELMYAGMSSESVIPNQHYLSRESTGKSEWNPYPSIIRFTNLLFCGDPHDEECQIIFSGAHLMLRIGGKNREGVAFGGPQIYGDQRGNDLQGLPGNMYKPHLDDGMDLFRALSKEQQRTAVVEASPIQTQIEVQGKGGAYTGVPVAGVSDYAKSLVRKLINLTFKPYASDDAAYAWKCIEHNGGLENLHLSFYADSTYEDEVLYQTYRIEGPGTVFYFRGFPHVHAFFNVAMDAENPLSLGDIVGTNPTILEGEDLQALFEAAMMSERKTDFVYYPLDSAVGKIRSGTVRTGDLCVAESWLNNEAMIAVKGSEVGGEFGNQLKARGITVQPDRIYSVATTDYTAKYQLEETFGHAEFVSQGQPLRDLLVNYTGKNGFSLS
jgi:hypothetical protein